MTAALRARPRPLAGRLGAQGPSWGAIFVEALQVKARVGVHAHERLGPQLLIIDIEVEVCAAPIDRLTDTVDYRVLAQAAHELAAEHIDLIETFAERLAARCLATPTVNAVAIAVRKPGALVDGMAGVRLRRERAANGGPPD